MDDANSNAQGAALSAGLKITGVKSVVLLGSSYPPYYNNCCVYASADVNGAYSPPPISAGQSEVVVEVEVTYWPN